MSNNPKYEYLIRPVDESEVPVDNRWGNHTGAPRKYEELAKTLRENPDQWFWVVTSNAKRRSSALQATLRKNYDLKTIFRTNAQKPEGFYIRVKPQPEPENTMEVTVG